MSRSQKHIPYVGDYKGSKKKRLANKKVRNWYKKYPYSLLQGNDYKKIYNTWDICDYYDISSFEKYYNFMIRRWYSWGWRFSSFPDKEKEYQRWQKYYKRK